MTQEKENEKGITFYEFHGATKWNATIRRIMFGTIWFLVLKNVGIVIPSFYGKSSEHHDGCFLGGWHKS